MQKVFERFY